MKELVDKLTPAERTALSVLIGAAILFAAVFIYTFLQDRPAARRAERNLAEVQANHRALSRQWQATGEDWTLWRQAVRDMGELKRTRFYSGENWYQDLRLDLQSIFDKAGISVSDVLFSYTDFAKEGIRKINADFRFNGSYAALKILLFLVERHPRLLCVEKIDFQDIESAAGRLEMKITLTGYYER